MLALSTYDNLPKGCEVQLVQAIYKEVHVQSMIQVDRRSVYAILSNLLDTRIKDLQSLGRDFVFGYIQCMDGEKDPRNLTMIFRCVPIIIHNFPIDVFIEELFEVVSCYFPIDFTPPPNDPYKVTQEELVLGLRKCLAATPKFAEHCLPLLMEKLSSDVQRAKIDSFLTLAECCEVYGEDDLMEFLPAMWSTIRREVFQAFSHEVEKSALTCLCSIVKTLSNAVSNANKAAGGLDEFLDLVLKDCSKHLRDPGLRLMLPTSKLLQSAASASDPACYKIISAVVPILLEQFHKCKQVNERVSLLHAALDFIKVCKSFTFGDDTPSPVIPFKDSLASLFLSLLSDHSSQLRCIGITGLVGLMSLNAIMNINEKKLAAMHFTNIVLTDQDNKVCSEAVTALAFMSMEFSLLVKEEVLPQLIKELDSRATGTRHRFIVNTLAGISMHSDIVLTTIPVMLQHLGTLSEDNTAESLETAVNTIQSIDIVVNSNISDEQCLDFFHSKLLPQLLRITVDQALQVNNYILCKEDVVSSIATVCRNIAKVLDDRVASNLVSNTISLFLDGNLENIGLKQSSQHFRPLEISSPWQHTQLVSLLTSIICSMKTFELSSQCLELMEKLLKLSLSSEHHLTCVSAAKCYAGLVNKHKQGTDLDSSLETVVESTCRMLQDEISDQNIYNRQKALTLWLWVTKALVLRAHFKSTQFTTKLISLFEDHQLSQMAADGFYIILSESQDVLNKDMHCDIKLMYRQRLFMQTLPRILAGFEKANEDKKQYYLSALSHLLQFIPKQVLLSELPPLMPMLVQSLYCQDVGLYVSTSDTLSMLIQDAPTVISLYVDTLLPQLLTLSTYQQSMKVRIAALKCIGLFVTLPTHVIYPRQKEVVRRLASVLDDRKRLVRQQAVTARGLWFLLEAPKK
uniref:MMS19 nucleotide excision repair protein n=1 Tax=Saccoglossus kowalevskii TaxID=10224 RepID=A0ABM0MAX1_SACKO|nr:PREDICTED: MMS19 nucleotide excision repair protein homolog [Saccoglossus kowalevskii]